MARDQEKGRDDTQNQQQQSSGMPSTQQGGGQVSGGQTGGQPSGMPQRFDPFYDLRAQMDRVFDSFMNAFQPLSLMRPPMAMGEFMRPMMMGMGMEMSPRVDIAETEDSLTITADLPGLDENDIDVTIANGALTLRGQKKAEREERKQNYHLMERSYGTFNRSFRLPDTVDPEKVDARFDKGVLTVTLPKTEAGRSQIRRIQINRAA
ncbi:MAG TPA: Hsp20/alpha crystallin family protein [Azospirillaceae bacterium]|nr:Hsp20/alpha crystallin family protein [Azospirillaceae bacterium]